jgi:hypothetical protein
MSPTQTYDMLSINLDFNQLIIEKSKSEFLDPKTQFSTCILLENTQKIS